MITVRSPAETVLTAEHVGPILQANNGDEPVTILLLPAIVILIGLLIVYSGAGTYKTSQLIKNTPTEKVSSMAVGRTELAGTARDAGETVDQPFTDGEALYADWRIRERYQTGTDDDGDPEYNWKTLDSGSTALRFELEDDTGTVDVVDTEDANFKLSAEKKDTIRVSDGAEVSGEPKEFLSGNKDGWDPDASPKSRRKQQYIQEYYPPDENAYIFGEAVPKDVEDVDASATNENRLEITGDSETGRFIISDMEQEVLTTKLDRWVPVKIIVGLAIAAGGVYWFGLRAQLVGLI